MRADEQADEITWRLLDLFRRMQEGFEKAAADVGLSAAEAGALRRLEHPVSMRSVADALHCDASYVTVLTDRLESLGLVERVPDEKDRRVKHLVLTEKGKRTRDDLTKRVHATSPALAQLDAAGRDELLEVLRRLSPEFDPSGPATCS